MKLDRRKKYSRIDSILYEDGVSILKLLQEFPINIPEFQESDFKYHEKYIAANPNFIMWTCGDEEIRRFKSDVGLAKKVDRVAVQVVGKDNPTNIEKANESSEVDSTLSRKDQVRWYLESGISSPKEIAEKLGTNPSYVQRLKKEIENESN